MEFHILLTRYLLLEETKSITMRFKTVPEHLDATLASHLANLNAYLHSNADGKETLKKKENKSKEVEKDGNNKRI
jgi:hypothetical protein